jgi:small-conductance mechanosensitive channel
VAITYPVATYGTIAVAVIWFVVHLGLRAWMRSSKLNGPERYRRGKFASTIVFLAAVVSVGFLWARLLQHKGTFFGLIGAGIAIALREPLLALAGRLAIFAAHMYTVGDRIEINQMTGDVIDVGLFYTRLMEVGNWIHADQATGRITQFSNSIIFANSIFNYTQNFNYIWDEIMLAVTYDSDIEEAKNVLLRAADEYTRQFLDKAQEQLERMRHSFLVPAVELKPSVFMEVTDNYFKLNLRYIVDPRKRRAAKDFLWHHILPAVQSNSDLQMGSSTMDLTVHGEDGSPQRATEDHEREKRAA